MAAVEDRRVDRTKAHDLQDFLVLSVPAVLAVLCGTEGWEDIELFADGGGDYVLARNRGQSPHDRVNSPFLHRSRRRPYPFSSFKISLWLLVTANTEVMQLFDEAYAKEVSLWKLPKGPRFLVLAQR
jgi:hypothetical protein